MSNRRPVASLTCKIGEQNYSILSIWHGNYPGAYSISRDKGSDKYPSIGDFKAFLTACASVWSGNGFLNLSIESEREPRGQRTPEQRSGGQYDRPSGNGGARQSSGENDFGGGDFGGGDDIPFQRASKGIAQ